MSQVWGDDQVVGVKEVDDCSCMGGKEMLRRDVDNYCGIKAKL